MHICKGCCAEITNRFLRDYCLGCIEKAMVDVTDGDIAGAMHDLVKQTASGDE